MATVVMVDIAFSREAFGRFREQNLRRRCENVQSNLGYSYGEGNRDRMKAAIFKRKRRELKREEVKGAIKCVA